MTFALLLVLGTCAALVLALIVRERVIEPRDRAREAARLAKLIPPLGPSHYRFTGHNDRLRQSADLRRRVAEQKRREAAQIASGIPEANSNRVVNRWR